MFFKIIELGTGDWGLGIRDWEDYGREFKARLNPVRTSSQYPIRSPQSRNSVHP
ncbi:hypothetical protein JYQ62_37520 [Nostoc sp. UHCC 0702]|nr:hypothetical protein JYQ62_37520 [Nostoc sp. UHCC 0702]